MALTLLIGCGPGAETAPAPKFKGVSAHWDQQKIPISMQCGGCHQKQFLDWAGSDHAWAFRELNAKHDSQPFHGQKFDNGIEQLRLQTDAQRRRIVTEPSSGKNWEARFALGRFPLVQYLVPAPDGGFHTTSAAWDVRKREWFDVFGGDARDAGNWGHWRGRGMNWNSQCAWCHMSGFRKNYNAAEDRYHSAWKEPGVTCIQCHTLKSAPDGATGCLAGGKSGAALTRQQTHDNCAACHSRRAELDDTFLAGDRFDDHYKLELPSREGIFWPNGMQRDEDYCETGLRLSRMGTAGVTCLDCHDPHTATLKLPQEDNAVCLRCHAVGALVGQTHAPVIKAEAHSPCPPGSMGARCVECHMPESLYMARDPRRDHSFNSPDPRLSLELGIPNACTTCHKGMTNERAAETVEAFYGVSPHTEAARRRTRAVQHAFEGKEDGTAEILAALAAEENGTWRAALLELLFGAAEMPGVREAALKHLRDAAPLARAAAVRILAALDDPAALSASGDSSRLVRSEAGWSLRHRLAPHVSARKEAEATARFQADQPPGAMKLARFADEARRTDEAEQWYRKACLWDPTGLVSRHDYALFLSRLGRNEAALNLLEEAVNLAPQDADMRFKKALCLAELNRRDEALDELDKAIGLAPDFLRALYNRAILRHSQGLNEGALADLSRCNELDASSPDYAYLQALILIQSGKAAEALSAALRANRRQPQHQPTLQLIQRLINDPSVRKAHGL